MMPQIQDVAVDALKAHCEEAVAAGGRMQMAYAWFPDAAESPEIRYLLHPGSRQPLQIWRCRPYGQAVPSLASAAPLLSWYEREITDLCGITFEGHPEPEQLVLLPGARASRPPLVPGGEIALDYESMPSWLPALKGTAPEDVQLLPFGPVRADVLESAQFHFYYVGEALLFYHPQLFFKHRGMEKRFEGQAPELGTLLAERISAVGGVAHSLAYCQALEAAAHCQIPARANRLRVLLAELERLYNHFHYLGHLCHTTTLKVGEAEGKLLEELAKQINGRASGSRFLRGLIIPGGLRAEPKLDGMAAALERLQAEFVPYAKQLESTGTHLDRLITTGALSRKLAFDQGATGPVERASGLDRDLRCDQPYAAYPGLPSRVAVQEAGDAHARQLVRITEIYNSLELIRHILQDLPGGAIRVPFQARPGSEGLGWAESPRGSLYYAVHLDAEGLLARVKVKSPSFSNWRVFPFTVHESNMMDYAINEASFGLTISGCAR